MVMVRINVRVRAEIHGWNIWYCQELHSMGFIRNPARIIGTWQIVSMLCVGNKNALASTIPLNADWSACLLGSPYSSKHKLFGILQWPWWRPQAESQPIKLFHSASSVAGVFTPPDLCPSQCTLKAGEVVPEIFGHSDFLQWQHPITAPCLRSVRISEKSVVSQMICIARRFIHLYKSLQTPELINWSMSHQNFCPYTVHLIKHRLLCLFKSLVLLLLPVGIAS